MTDHSDFTDLELQHIELLAPADGEKDAPTEPASNVIVLPKRDRTAPQATAFDYSGVSAAVAREAEATAARIKERMRTHILETGKELSKIKKKLGHGKFGKWLEFHFGWKERTAQNYMNSATAFGSAPRVIDVLPPSTVYKLAAKSTPVELRQLVVDAVERGDVPDPKQIENQLAQKKAEARQRREAGAVVQNADLAVSGEIPGQNTDASTSLNSTISEPIGTVSNGEVHPVSEAYQDELRAKKVVEQLKIRFGVHFGQLRHAMLETDLGALKKALQEA
ncbi:DUF3102 domain-containing protein [Agrobacterium vitis]|uniref:DUF3102 domain-containing protein n=1 Tax=Agrobacterium vitis TaxID=373 RepID=UPI0018D205EB|nr:DUF3102 domain-containing protein [Agrobacterium vitis]